jgi:hypothetical protein
MVWRCVRVVDNNRISVAATAWHLFHFLLLALGVGDSEAKREGTYKLRLEDVFAGYEELCASGQFQVYEAG